jgi:hypothetical protein
MPARGEQAPGTAATANIFRKKDPIVQLDRYKDRRIEGAGYNLSRLRAASKEAHRVNADAVAWWPLKVYSRQLLLGLGLILLLSVVLYLRSQN